MAKCNKIKVEHASIQHGAPPHCFRMIKQWAKYGKQDNEIYFDIVLVIEGVRTRISGERPIATINI